MVQYGKILNSRLLEHGNWRSFDDIVAAQYNRLLRGNLRINFEQIREFVGSFHPSVLGREGSEELFIPKMKMDDIAGNSITVRESEHKMLIASASTSVQFHEFPRRNHVYTHQPSTSVDGSIRSISWSKDGVWLILVPHSGSAEIISLRDNLESICKIHDIESPSCAAFQNTTKRYVALGTKSGQILLYDIKLKITKKKFASIAHSDIRHIAFTATDSHLIASTSKGTVVVYNCTSNMLVNTFKIPKSGSVSALRLTASKRKFVSCGSNEGVVAVWDIYENKAVFCASAHKAPVTAVTFLPQNSNVILTAGLDRQFSLYDTSTRENIANVAVGNNILAADFSPDGNNFVLASQKGKILIYDRRRIYEPAYVLDAHRSAIKHLLFQPSQKYKDPETLFSNPGEESTQRDLETLDSKKDSTDSFGLYVPGSPTVVTSPKIVISPNVTDADNNTDVDPESTDSFMAAMGLCDSPCEPPRQEKAMGIPEGVKKWLQSKVSLNETPCVSSINSTPGQPKISQDKLSLGNSKLRKSSTPNFRTENVDNISPIPRLNVTATQNVKLNDSLAEIRGEMSRLIENMKSDIDHQFFLLKSNIMQLRCLCLDSLMSNVREFTQIKDHLSSLQDFNDDNELLQENFLLRSRIEELETQLAFTNSNLS